VNIPRGLRITNFTTPDITFYDLDDRMWLEMGKEQVQHYGSGRRLSILSLNRTTIQSELKVFIFQVSTLGYGLDRADALEQSHGTLTHDISVW